ncbi:RagB/SusD family nutrient uptake outer membrane protein [Fulvivirgaceae bacterium BMA12]|uniref:RagB/SusD family nutrient uptake outer membrane protein n=1 Tax=Agaribacillus aureus TaxID=3051825 RepID=A0ABT8L1Y3_9BACT|nr:RagB/SusD family nutrient uptake outer membrane protein [Fulvivirgaceae bacterium BMA12]
MKTIFKIIPFIVILTLGSCDEFLEELPQGSLSEEQLVNSEEGVEALVIAAYSTLNGQIDNASNAFNSPATNWSFGDVVADDAYKGGGGVGDQNNVHLMEIFSTNSGIIDLERKWLADYEGISRANAAIRAIRDFEGWEQGQKDQRIAEMKLLRGHFYFDLKKLFNLIPYIDENLTTSEEIRAVSNRQLTSGQLWSKIEEDFLFARGILPDVQQQVGRATKGAANAYLAKTYIFQEKWNEASQAADLVINSPAGYELLENFINVFEPEFNNSDESVFSIQYSINDGAGTNGYNGSIGDRLINPGGPFFAIRGFLRPTQNLINSYKTDANGLPLFDTFNDADLTEADFVDPRLDHTVGRPGIPYLELPEVYEASWARDPDVYGPYSPKKRVVPFTKPEFTLTVWPYSHAMNYIVIRYADVLLWKAEALIETGDLEGARAIINQVRGRARDGQMVMKLDGSAPAANYLVGEYTTTWTDADLAMEALQFERRLEFAHEGHRFFDLARWGIAEQVMNDYIQEEQSKRTYLSGAEFQAGKHEYFPIPRNQIDLSGGLLEQNPGY